MDAESVTADLQPPVPPAHAKPTVAERTVALIEVILCSDFPTQIALGLTFAAIGFQPKGPTGSLNLGYVAALSLADTVLLIGLIVIFLIARGERVRDVFLGPRPALTEARAGVPMTLAAFGIAAIVMVALRVGAPWLHTVEQNPLQDLLQTPRDAGIFALVVVIAGGVREELQRAFILHRFEYWLGGGTVGVIISSIAFGAGHVLQGADAAIVTGLLGAFWAVTYLRRRSVVAPMVSHSGFDLLQVAQFLVFGR